MRNKPNVKQQSPYLDPAVPDDMQTMTALQLAQIVGRSIVTLKQDVSRRPDSLPPRMVVPGSKALLWRVVDVRAWMQALADMEHERRRAGAAAARRAGQAVDFGHKSFQLSNAAMGQGVTKRFNADAAASRDKK